MAIHRHQDFMAWQLAEAFKGEVIRILKSSAGAQSDRKFHGQLFESARAPSNDIAEGFRRKSARVFATFLDYAIASLAEAEGHLRDGVAIGYFPAEPCVDAHRFAKRCMVAMIRLKQSQMRYANAMPQPRVRRGRQRTDD